jgi:membrane associated rhomboid family serine protease
MQIHVPDPAYTTSDRARANFRLAVRIALTFVALLWVIQVLNWALDLGPEDFGVRPRQVAGLVGILLAPLVHGGFVHLIGNTLPLLVSGTTMLYLYPRSVPVVFPAVYLGPGIAVWLFASGSSHLGASGLVYGLVSYIFVAGLIRRDRRAIGASLLVAFMYGTLVWGVLPIENGVSWETHLAAGIIGVLLAVALRKRDIPPRSRYSWEGMADEPEEWRADAEQTAAEAGSDAAPSRTLPPPPDNNDLHEGTESDVFKR